MFVLNLSAENWVGNQDEGDLIESPTWSQIEQAIRELNGKTKTLVTLGADDECYMSIGGGESGKYIVNITFDNVSFHNLVDPSKPDAIEKLVVGGQEGNYSAKMCVKLETALLATQTFSQGCFILRRGKPPVVAPMSETPVKSSVGGRARGVGVAPPYKIAIFVRMKPP